MAGRAPMTKPASESNAEERAQELLAASAAAELRLIKQERKAEQNLAAARTFLERDQQRLARAVQRVERSRDAVFEAEAELRACQERRAAGPAEHLV